MDSEGNFSDAETSKMLKKRKTVVQIQEPVNEEIFNLPEEIIVEILARLPVKTLLKFRLVSKSWLGVISSPEFIKLHLYCSENNRILSNYRIMCTISSPGFDLKDISVRSLMSEPLAEAYSINYPKKSPQRAVFIVGSCNGLICIAIKEKDFFLWNPATRKSKKLPPVNVNIRRGFYNIYGFGFNESDGDYKVVGIFFVFGNEGAHEYASMVKVYSLKTNSWKRIEDFKGGIPLDDSGKFASGKLHWSASSNSGLDFRWDIVSLDVKNEEYGLVEQPNYGEGDLDSTLGVLDGCICILCNYQHISANVWVLKDYGVRDSWTKIATIPSVNYARKFSYSKPLYMSPSGEILLVVGIYFIVYDMKNKCVRISETSNLCNFLEADIFVESLVSPLEI